MRVSIPRTALFFAITILVNASCDQRTLGSVYAARYSAGQSQSKLIRCEHHCDEIAATIVANGGRVSARYRNFSVLAADITPRQLALITAKLGQNAVTKDLKVASPNPIGKLGQESTPLIQIKTVDLNTLQQIAPTIRPLSIAQNNVQTGANLLHAQNITGESVIVAVIDSGTANNSTIVPLLRDTVIGGENLVTKADEPSATSTKNDDHGTWIGVMIAGHGSIVLPADSDLAKSIQTHSPESIQAINDTELAVPVVGTAPQAKIYAVKTFPANGDGAPSSRILAAMDRVLTLKKNFLAGMATTPVSGDGSEDNPFVYEALDIKVLNMSLGGPTLFPGNDLDDVVTQQLLDADITVVTSAGNEGFAAMTEASPASGLGTLAVGAASNPVNERILRDTQKGLGTGIRYRPTDHLQVAIFSSRGPTADGRQGVHILANGHAAFVQGATGNMTLVSGTSLSAPTIAGAAALLRSAYPKATARDIRSALIAGANPNKVGSFPSFIDQGFGFVDLPKSHQLLANLPLPEILPTTITAASNSRVKDNIAPLGFKPIPLEIDKKTGMATWENSITLLPGQAQQYFVETRGTTKSIQVNLTAITPELPPEQQNELFTDDVAVNIIDAPLSFDDRRVRDFTNKPTVYDIDKPQTGLVRVALMGDWTNKGKVTVAFTITTTQDSTTLPATRGSLMEKQTNTFEFSVEPETTRAELSLSWKNNWTFYPAHDLDLLIIDPSGTTLFDGVTMSSPERVVIDKPAAGTWTVVVDGFTLHDMTDNYQLRGVDQLDRALNFKVIAPAP